MGLDARVFCNCIENGRLKVPHPYPELLYLRSDGLPCMRSDDLQKQLEHDKWFYNSPCEHQECTVIKRRIGNISFVGWVREAIKMFSLEPEKEYLIIWNKVVYSGTHSGDSLALEDVSRLDAELVRMRKNDLRWQIPRWLNYMPSFLYWKFVPKKELQKRFLIEFIETMTELAKASLTVKKPISFF